MGGNMAGFQGADMVLGLDPSKAHTDVSFLVDKMSIDILRTLPYVCYVSQ